MYQPTFARAANEYESYALPQGKAVCRLVERLLETVDLKSVHSILDVGCGTAYATKILLSKFNDTNVTYPDLCVLVDRENSMLKVGSQKIQELFKIEPQCVLADAFDSKWTVSYRKHDQSLGRRVVISSYLLQWSLKPLDVLISTWINLLAKGDILAISFPDARSFEWLRRSLMTIGLEDRTLKLYDSDVLIGTNAVNKLSAHYKVISYGRDNDSVAIKQPSDYLRHFSKIGSTPSSQRYSSKEVKSILKGLSLLAEKGHPCQLDYYSTWLVLERL